MKKLLVLFLSVVLLMSILPTVSVFAAKEPTFVVSSDKANVGDKVKITISTKNNPGIVSMKLLVDYDSTALELVKYKEGEFSGTTFSPNTSKPFIINWIDSIHPNNKTNGTVATLTFKVLSTAPNGKSDIKITYDPEDVFALKDLEFNNVTFAVQNGYVDIKNPNANTQAQTSTKPITSSQQAASSELVDSLQSAASSQDSGSSQTTTSNEQQVTSSDSANQMQDTTTSQILEQIYNSANQNSSQSEEFEPDGTTLDEMLEKDNQNSWIIWVIVAAVVVLGGAFAVVIINSKKNK